MRTSLRWLLIEITNEIGLEEFNLLPNGQNVREWAEGRIASLFDDLDDFVQGDAVKGGEG